MKPITTLVTRVLAEYDLECLISSGAPEDEYLIEAEPITAFIINNRYKLNDSLLADNIQYVFIRYFGDLIDYNNCILVARDIMKRLNEQGVM